MHEELSPQEILAAVAEATRLREGPEGVRSILRVIGDRREMTTRQVATAVRLPLPVVAAVRGELTALGVLERQPHGVRLTEQGRNLAAKLFGSEVSSNGTYEPQAAEEMAAFAERLREIAERRPDADVTLDQAKATPLTLARRVSYFDRNDALAGRRILCLGDDDFVAAAIAEWTVRQNARGRAARPERVLVVDCDRRIVEQIAALGKPVEARLYDARDPWPEAWRGRFDVVITDPPYTIHGAELFLSRAIDAVGAKPGTRCFFSFGHLDPSALRTVQAALAEMGWVVREWLPGFNEYEGSGVLAGISLMAHLILADAPEPVIVGRYDGPLYTADVRPVVRIYRCQGCHAQWEVGPGTRWQTIAHLKRQTCPLCGANRFLRTGQRPAG